MGEINICNSADRDAVVLTTSVRSAKRIRWLDSDSRQAQSVRVVKAPIDHDISALKEEMGDLSKVSEALVVADPEIDLDQTGRFLRDTSRVYVNGERQIVHKVKFWEVVRNPDRSERERRPRKLLDPNLAGETPLRWSGKYVDKDEACRKFVFSGKVQLRHVNGLTYDFLYGMAKELHDRNSLLLLGAGPKSNEPIILRRGGSPYRGFLEGRIDGDKYALILHFSNLELKAPAPKPAESTDEEATS